MQSTPKFLDMGGGLRIFQMGGDRPPWGGQGSDGGGVPPPSPPHTGKPWWARFYGTPCTMGNDNNKKKVSVHLDFFSIFWYFDKMMVIWQLRQIYLNIQIRLNIKKYILCIITINLMFS